MSHLGKYIETFPRRYLPAYAIAPTSLTEPSVAPSSLLSFKSWSNSETIDGVSSPFLWINERRPIQLMFTENSNVKITYDRFLSINERKVPKMLGNCIPLLPDALEVGTREPVGDISD